jgi:hypothetical protein
MRKESIWLVVSCVIMAVFLMVSCAPAVTEEEEATSPEGVEKKLSEEESQRIAFNYLLHGPTLTSRGIDDSLRLLDSIPLEQPFAWQFDYAFQCQYPGYGSLGSEPTPPMITPHEARIIVQEGEVIYAVLDGEWDVLLATSSETTSQEKSAARPPATVSGGNEVSVSFIEESAYKISGDSFINKEVTVERWWRTNLLNLSDETGAPVTGLRLTLDSEVSFGRIEDELLTMRGPPIYEWSLDDVPNGEYIATDGWGWDAYVRRNSTKKLAPGYDVSRSFDKTIFSAQGVQTLTITITPREESIDTVTITVHTDKDTFVDPVVLSYSSPTGGEVKIEQGGHRSEISFVPVEPNTPTTVAVTLQVTPKVPLVHYKPDTGIRTGRVSVPDRGITTGRSVSFTNKVGTWTWSAEGDYVWDWGVRASPDVNVSFGRASPLPISILILGVVILGAIIIGIILRRRRRKMVSA